MATLPLSYCAMRLLRSPRAGFTLVELALTLVFIGTVGLGLLVLGSAVMTSVVEVSAAGSLRTLGTLQGQFVSRRGEYGDFHDLESASLLPGAWSPDSPHRIEVRGYYMDLQAFRNRWCATAWPRNKWAGRRAFFIDENNALFYSIPQMDSAEEEGGSRTADGTISPPDTSADGALPLLALRSALVVTLLSLGVCLYWPAGKPPSTIDKFRSENRKKALLFFVMVAILSWPSDDGEVLLKATFSSPPYVGPDWHPQIEESGPALPDLPSGFEWRPR